MTTRAERMQRRQRVDALAGTQGWVVSRSQLRMLGVDRNPVTAEVAARRWFLPGQQTVAVCTGALSMRCTGGTAAMVRMLVSTTAPGRRSPAMQQ